MRSIIRGHDELSELRASIRHDLALPGEAEATLGDFVTAVNEVTAASLAGSGADTRSVEVRWARRTHPRAELWAEVRNTSDTAIALLGDDIGSIVLRHSAERVEVEERIGGSVVTIRSRT